LGVDCVAAVDLCAHGRIGFLLVLALLWATAAKAQVDPYAGLQTVVGESHQHAATYWMHERLVRDPPVPGFGYELHENGTAATAFDTMRRGGYEWGTVIHHDANLPGRANVALLSSSGKFYWWSKNVSAGFPGASPAWSESHALAVLARTRTTEGAGGFLGFSGREFTGEADTPRGIGARQGGHKVVILPAESAGLCTADAVQGDEYCPSEYRLFRSMARDPVGQGIVIQAHPGGATGMDLRPLDPINAPGGFSDAFIQGVEVSSAMQDPQWEPNYLRMLALGYRVFPAFGSDSHLAAAAGYEASARRGGTVCWVESRTRAALIRAMHLRRCYYAASWKPEVRFRARSGAGGSWVGMGGLLHDPDGRIEVRIDAINDPRNFHTDPRRGRRFDMLDLVASDGRVIASGNCARAPDGRDTCVLSAPALAIARGAIFPRIRMRDPNPIFCRSRNTPALLPYCGWVVIGSAIYVNWPQVVATAPYRACTFGRNDVPCGTPGCLSASYDRDGDGYPNGCDVCPDLANPNQADTNRDGFGDACGRPLAAPQVLSSN
jgi:hypothetical protein